MTKLDHWQTRTFPNFLRERASTPFCWGKNDCAMFAADAIRAITGIDIASDFRGKYTTELGAMKTIKQVCGGSSVVDAAIYCATKHGLMENKHPLMAKVGDLVIVSNGGTMIAGVVHTNGREVVSVGESGLVLLPITQVTRSWSI